MDMLLKFLLVLVIGQILVMILTKRFVPGFNFLEAWKKIGKAFLGLLGNGKELALFAMFELVAIGASAVVLAIFGPRVGVFVLLASVCLFALWATKPPAKPR
jgi:hypothetical protein